VQDAAGYLVQDERSIADLHRVAGVGPALIPHHPVGALGDDVDELALPFVTPLRPDDDEDPRRAVEHVDREKETRGRRGPGSTAVSHRRRTNAKRPARLAQGVEAIYGAGGGVNQRHRRHAP
jgi:predicted flap endonuclease-1-like 5' DNA nuclease